ncbi:hypothetical protein HYH03_008799 [Edaphochlamys debaryana]|uniref:Uncharacterized protein n=1 Tax=Edaphochlamys debaryana TaxID=47281 RepID=A0A835Y041_9CHLO|nr:hypothetical protein HYH03_008799 [Edaphochlamys debaryana]|eukprot:KAG2492884.1 hypothetical protein HYH03_008799 [Edaphochlamys debaryana]
MGCQESVTKASCPDGCVWKTSDEMYEVIAPTSGPVDPTATQLIRQELYWTFFRVFSFPAADPPKHGGACTAAGLWTADFDALIAKGVRADNGSTSLGNSDFRALYRAVGPDLLGTCPGGRSLLNLHECYAASDNDTACVALAPICEYRWDSPSSGYCAMVEPLVDPNDPFYTAVREADTLCHKTTTSACASTGGTINTGVTPWETLLATLPSYATGTDTGGKPKPTPKRKPSGSPGKKGTAAPPPRRHMRSYPPFRHAPPPKSRKF